MVLGTLLACASGSPGRESTVARSEEAVLESGESKPSESDPQVRPSSESEPRSACESLALAACDRVRLSCEGLVALAEVAALDAERCVDAQREIVRLDDTGRLRGREQIRVLVDLLETSETLGPQDWASFRQRPAPPAFSYEVDGALRGGDAGVLVRIDVECPGSSRVYGDAPPAGNQRGCARATTGARHGPWLAWATAAEPVRRVEYRDGLILEVEYLKTSEGTLPQSMFVCPEGSRRVEVRRTASALVLGCRGPDRMLVGSSVTWHGDCVAAVDRDDGGRWVGDCPPGVD